MLILRTLNLPNLMSSIRMHFMTFLSLKKSVFFFPIVDTLDTTEHFIAEKFYTAFFL